MKKIKNLRTGLFSRQLTLAKLAIKSGKDFFLSDEKTLKEKIKSGLKNNVTEIVHDLGLMKGSLLKAGQMLSLHLGDLLPKEAREILRSLENQSTFVEWEAIKKQIPLHFFEKLIIDQTPLAAASLGQVHQGVIKETSQAIAIKIQYPGVQKAIDNDIRSLKLLLKVLKIIPKGLDLSEIYTEIKTMLLQETDYIQEKNHTEYYNKLITEFENKFIVPKTYDEFCTEKILTTELMIGESIRSKSVRELSQERRNQLGKNFFVLYLKEVFHWGVVQTDAHFGNFLIKINNQTKQDQWILLDFGATKIPDKEFLKLYQQMIKSCVHLDKHLFFLTAKKINPSYPFNETQNQLLWEYAELIAKPFQNGLYNWGSSNIPEKVLELSEKIAKDLAVGTPPGEAIFLDRKIGGVFQVLKALRCEFNPKDIFNSFS